MRREPLQTSRLIFGLVNLVAINLKEYPEHISHVGVVLDDQHAMS